MEYKTIALDAMGGDHGPKVVLPAALKALGKHPDLKIILVGQEDVINRYLKRLKIKPSGRLVVHNAQEIVEMDESPALALRNKKDSSMRVAINLVHDGEAKACVSAGNTGALMATARFVLKTLPGIDRPAIINTFPRSKGVSHVLDLGANIDSSSEHLFQFAVMGAVLTSAVCNIESPSVGLLNVGTEDIKGSEQVKATAQLLEDCDYINYTGYVEGSEIFLGDTDVIVCDGFVGNIALKSVEGVVKFIRNEVTKEFKKNWLTTICGLVSLPILNALKRSLSPEHHNGASLVGLNGIVIKSHGSAKVLGYYHAIEEALLELEKNVPEQIRCQLQEILH